MKRTLVILLIDCSAALLFRGGQVPHLPRSFTRWSRCRC